MKKQCQGRKKTTNKKRIYGKGNYPSSGEITLSLPIEEIVADTYAEIEALAGEAGLMIMMACMEREVERYVGERYRRDSERRYFRWGKQRGAVDFAGQRVRIMRPRVRDKRRRKEKELKSYAAFSKGSKLGEAVAGKLLLGISTRDYKESIEGFCEGYGIERSNVSRGFVRATSKRLDELMSRDLRELSFEAIVIDGIEYRGHLVVVALGIDSGGYKQILGLRMGASENAVVVTELLESVVERGLSVDRPTLFVLDGSKALRKGVKKIWGDLAIIQRCQLHKRRNVKGHLPPERQEEVDRRIRNAYAMGNYEDAKKSLMTTHRWLQRLNPSAARSLEEGMDETLTVHRLNLPDELRRSLSTTNVIESCFDYVRKVTRNVKRWRDGAMVLRWVGCGLLQAETRFRRIRGCKKMPHLKSALKNFIDKGNVDSYAMVA
jgi:putative transposase